MNNQQEILRLQQLQMMGITSYFPRFALQGALPSELRSWDIPVEPVEDTEPETLAQAPVRESVQRQPEPAQRYEKFARDIEPVVAKAVIEKTPVASPGTTEKTPPREESRDSELTLHLLLIPVDVNLCVLNQIPVLAKSQMQEKQQKLLDNILFFLGRQSAVYHSARTFRWPLPGMSNINSADAAKSSLRNFLEQFSQENTFSNLLVMGEQASDWLREAGNVQNAIAPAKPQWQMIHTYSLDQMLTLPSIKREVWQHLLPLQARLQQG